MISPIFERLAREYTQEGTVGFYKVNVDDVPDLAEAVGIRAVCVLFFLFDLTSCLHQSLD